MRWILATVAALLAVLYTEVATWYPAAAWLQGPLPRLLWPLLAVAAMLAALLLARRRPGRDLLAHGWAAFSLCGCLLLAPLVIARDRQAAADRAAEDRMAGLRVAQRTELARRDQLRRAGEADRRERSRTDRYAQYEGRIPASALDSLRALDAQMNAEVRARADGYAAALAAHPTHGPSSWIVVRTLAELEAERNAHRRLYEETRTFTQFVESFESRYSAAIAALGLAPPADRVAVAELERILQMWERDSLYTLRQLDERILAAALRALDTLHAAWGGWSYNPRESELVFADPAREEAFHHAVAEMQHLAREIGELTQPPAKP